MCCLRVSATDKEDFSWLGESVNSLIEDRKFKGLELLFQIIQN